MKQLFSWMLIAALSICASSCSDDDESSAVGIYDSQIVGSTSTYNELGVLTYTDIKSTDGTRVSVKLDTTVDDNIVDITIYNLQILSKTERIPAFTIYNIKKDATEDKYTMDNFSIEENGAVVYTLSDIVVKYDEKDITVEFKVAGQFYDPEDYDKSEGLVDLTYSVVFTGN